MKRFIFSARFLKVLFGAAWVFLLTWPGYSQILTATVKRNVNLRSDPSSNNPPIRLLTPPEELRLLSLQRVNRYYHVFTEANEEGWVWSARLEVDNISFVAVVRRNVNLRPTASSADPAIRLLVPPDTLQLLDLERNSGYYNVRTRAGEEGWVLGARVEILQLGPDIDPPPQTQPVFPDARNEPIPGWTGPVFKLSQDYPQAPPPQTLPWKQFDFRTQAEQYLQSVLDYAMEGNLQVDWQGDRNAVRKWYHTPWLHPSANGREFVHGLTRERSSRPRELHPNQRDTFVNWAVGLYNPAGGFVIGQVWRDPDNPDASAARFPDGAVAVKLLFTTAPVEQVPYLRNAFEWDAHVFSSGTSTRRTIQKVRLLQIDVAVRDSRTDATTGWVFGTFSYDGNASGATPWQRMIPIGLMWGNDPTLTPGRFAAGNRPVESVILNRVVGINQHLGWLERLNGPVDNPRSSCLSCHSTAQFEQVSGPVPRASASDETKMRWFRNIPAGTAFDAGQQSLDYSLQLHVGIRNFFRNRRPPVR